MIDLQAYLARLAGKTPVATSQWDGGAMRNPQAKAPPTSPTEGMPLPESFPAEAKDRR